MEIIIGSHLMKVDRTEKPASEIFAENDIVLLYLSAHWCPPCRIFTPILTDVYNNLKKAGKKIEVLFMSSDKTEEKMMAYMEEMHGDWFAFQFGTPLKKQIFDFFGLKQIPCVIVLTGGGKVISTDGRREVEERGVRVWKRWTSAVQQLDMEIFIGSHLMKVDRTEKPASEIFAENDIVLLYLSAHWCPSCQLFTPILTDVYNNLKKAGKKIEVLFMSFDKTEENMMAYMEEMHGDWFAFQFGTPLRKQIFDFFGLKQIPLVIVLTGGGKVISTDGRREVEKRGVRVWRRWTSAANSYPTTNA